MSDDEGHLDDDTVGHHRPTPWRIPRSAPAGDLDEDEDVAGHLRMTEDQLAAGATPAEVLVEEAERRRSGDDATSTGG